MHNREILGSICLFSSKSCGENVLSFCKFFLNSYFAKYLHFFPAFLHLVSVSIQLYDAFRLGSSYDASPSLDRILCYNYCDNNVFGTSSSGKYIIIILFRLLLIYFPGQTRSYMQNGRASNSYWCEYSYNSCSFI